MPRKPHTRSHQYPTDADVIEALVRSVGGDLTAKEMAAIKAGFSSWPAIDPSRHLVCLSAPYRSSLYDLLGAAHPEVFTEADSPLFLQKVSSIMNDFLRQQLKKDNVDVTEDVFGMLFLDFIGSEDFHIRRTSRKK